MALMDRLKKLSRLQTEEVSRTDQSPEALLSTDTQALLPSGDMPLSQLKTGLLSFLELASGLANSGLPFPSFMLDGMQKLIRQMLMGLDEAFLQSFCEQFAGSILGWIAIDKGLVNGEPGHDSPEPAGESNVLRNDGVGQIDGQREADGVLAAEPAEPAGTALGQQAEVQSGVGAEWDESRATVQEVAAGHRNPELRPLTLY